MVFTISTTKQQQQQQKNTNKMSFPMRTLQFFLFIMISFSLQTENIYFLTCFFIYYFGCAMDGVFYLMVEILFFYVTI